MEILLLLFVAAGGIGLVYLGPRAVWMVRFPFLWLNQLLWFLTNPLRLLFRDPQRAWPRRLFLLLLPFYAVYWAAMVVLLFPLRLIDAVYFDLLLFWSAGLRDGLAHVLAPQRGRVRHLRGWRYGLAWCVGLPVRLMGLLVRYPAVIFQGLAMFAVDCVWPSRTMLHGTRFEGAATDIVQTGRWYVGSGDYCGEGIYFGAHERVARHYAPSSSPAIILARVTLTLCRPVSTLPESSRRLLGTSQSRQLAARVPWPWAALEHWRTGTRWYEYCLPMPGQQGQYVRSWRIRPLCVIRGGVPARIHSGLAFWPMTLRGWGVLALSVGLVFVALVVVSGG